MKRSIIRIPLICLFLALFACVGCDADLHDPQTEHFPSDSQEPNPNIPQPPQNNQPTETEPEVQQPDTHPEDTQDAPVDTLPTEPDVQPPTDDTPAIEQPDDDTPVIDKPDDDTPAIVPPIDLDRPIPLPDTEPATGSAAVPLKAEGLHNLFQVSQELYRSAQPAESGLTSAKSLGIQTVLSLQLVSLDNALEANEQTGLTLEHVPMVPWNVTETELLLALEVIRDAPKPILVHCLHGADRTGLVIAMYRILFQNWSISDAKEEMISDTFGYHEEFANLPELLEQIDIEAMRSKIF